MSPLDNNLFQTFIKNKKQNKKSEEKQLKIKNNYFEQLEEDGLLK